MKTLTVEQERMRSRWLIKRIGRRAQKIKAKMADVGEDTVRHPSQIHSACHTCNEQERLYVDMQAENNLMRRALMCNEADYLEALKEAEAEQKSRYREAYLTERIPVQQLPSIETPSALREIRNLCRFDQNIQSSYVYFLVDGNDVVYVGQTTQPLPTRLYEHERTKTYTAVYYIEVDYPALNAVEAHYIQMFRPRYNKSFSPAGQFLVNFDEWCQFQ